MYRDDRIKKMGLTVKDLFNLMHIDYSEIEWLCGCRIRLKDTRYSCNVLDRHNTEYTTTYVLDGTRDVNLTPVQLLKLPVEYTELTYTESGNWVYLNVYVDLTDYCDYKSPRTKAPLKPNRRMRRYINGGTNRQ